MKKSLLLFVTMLASVGMWAATTFKLTQVSSVSAGEKYVFVQDTHAFGSTVSNSALQTVTGFKTEGLEGTEDYVWTLESAEGGFLMKNESVSGDNKYLKNTSSTSMSFVASNSLPSVWSFDFTDQNAVLIQNVSLDNRFLGYTTSTSYVYKAYAASNLKTYPHAIKVYKLEEEDGNGGSGDSGDSGEEPGGDSGNDPVVPEMPAVSDSITVWAEDFSGVDFGGRATTTDLTTIKSATFVIAPEGGATLYKNQNTAGGTAPEILLPCRTTVNGDPVPSVLSVTINDLKSCYGNMVLTLKSNAADDATTFAVGTTTDGVTVDKVKSAKIWNVSVPKGTTSLTLTFTNSNSNNNYRLDDFVLKCPGATCTVGQYGYATFSSTKALDLDNMVGGVAYVATAATNDAVTIEPASGIVPANTGLIIKGNAGTCFIPVSSESGVVPATNLLQAVTADNTEIAAGNYVLGVDNEEVKFLLVEDVLPKLNAGKSYLAAPAGARGRALRFVEGEANGINDVNVEAVVAPAKRIVNGKLVIEKAGKMFNAAGAQIK